MGQSRIPYDDRIDSLIHPEVATNFFPLHDETNDAGLCAEMARLAYMKFEQVDARRAFDDFLARVGFRSVDFIDKGSTQGFVADGLTRDSGPVRLIAFRGTQPDDVGDVFDGLGVVPVQWEAGGLVHGGFARAFDRVRSQVIGAIDGAGPDQQVVVTGHSLGAALGTLAASLSHRVRLFVFGSPRVGDRHFTSLVAPGRYERFVDYLDCVTRVPPPDIFDYAHLDIAQFIDRTGTIHRDLTDAEIMKRQRDGGCRDLSIGEILRRLRAEDLRVDGVPIRDLTDHAPINYTSAVLGIRG